MAPFVLAVHGDAKPATLVSNAGQSDGGPGSLANDHAQGFTTGANAAGYSLTGVDLKLALTTGTAPTFTVKIHEDHPDGLGTPHDAVVGTLTRQGDLSATAAPVRFAAPEGGLDLDPGTRYFVVLDITAGATGNATIGRIATDDEDAGAADGWSIENLRLFKLQSANLVDPGEQQRPPPAGARRIRLHEAAGPRQPHHRDRPRPRGDGGRRGGVHGDVATGAERRRDGEPDGLRVGRLRGGRERGLEDGDGPGRRGERRLPGGDRGRHRGRDAGHGDGGAGRRAPATRWGRRTPPT